MKIAKIEAGFFQCDGGAIFGVVPKRVWQKRYPCDDDNFCKLAMRLLLIETGQKLILIDSGTGDKQLQYLRYYGFQGVIDFDTELKKLGYRCADVTDVVMTHLHFDHCGGNTRFNNDKTGYELTFPNADVWVGKDQWENFLNPNVREGDSYFKENMMPVADAGKLKLVETDTRICDEVLVKIMNGHTAGQLVPYVSTPNETFVYVGDVIPMAANLPLAWVSAFDTFPITSMEDKEQLLAEAAAKNQILFFEHDAYTECCRVELVNNKYRIKESFSLSSVTI
ncbi:MAG: MBL fold metallo-hydrolase [Bacteroidota bacterium]|nr:MBL fold metallo-hydrolase [Bacteroidota bacterium]